MIRQVRIPLGKGAQNEKFQHCQHGSERSKDRASRPSRAHRGRGEHQHHSAGGSVPFVHWHRKNEEIYGIISGSGRFEVDGESVPLKAGDWIRIAPQGKRRIFASEDSAISFVCIQVKAGSLEEFTAGDAEA